MSQIVAIYAGSFDPITTGHLDVITRAAKIFSKVVIAVGVSADKKTLFSENERVEMVNDVIRHLPNVCAYAHGGLTVEFAKKHQATVLVRGLRSGADYTYEMAMAQMNRHLAANLETIFIPTKSEYFHVSSSLVKDVARHNGDLSSLVPTLVAKKLSEKFHR